MDTCSLLKDLAIDFHNPENLLAETAAVVTIHDVMETQIIYASPISTFRTNFVYNLSSHIKHH